MAKKIPNAELVVLDGAGHAANIDQPESFNEALRQLNGLILVDEQRRTARLQPCKSPVWDTALSVRAICTNNNRPVAAAVGRAVEWMLNREVRRAGDWAMTTRAEPRPE